MAATLSQSRALAGCKAFTGVRPRQVSAVSNGVKYTMKRKDSYMVEVQVGEDEPEDIAVRRFMKQVVESRLIEQLRARRYKETPLEEYKRRTKERIEARKNRVVLPTYEELYGLDSEVKPFEEFFSTDPDMQDTGFVDGFLAYGQEDTFASAIQQQGGYIDAGAAGMWGGYVGNTNGGYMTQQAGGYMQ